MKRFGLLTVGLAIALSGVTASLAFGDDDNNGNPQAIPFTFVGTAAGCTPGAAGSNIVTSAWLTGLGLPDDGSSNTAPTNRDPHFGLLLSKNGLTTDCSAAGATINGVKGQVVTELGFDIRNGTHCGAGAPRFNLVTDDNVFHFMGGCSNGTATPAPQHPAEWTRIRINPTNPAQAFPPVAAGAKIKSLSIIFDEGTDTPTVQDPMGVGLAVIDNIDVNGHLITARGNGDDKGNGNGEDNGKGDH
ncbi:MAG TPA: hypothetical protein VEU96_26485 [Bryobacteraceae bacterium]|nr:hypothetical protein [Bryobacteraceae bacterium]